MQTTSPPRSLILPALGLAFGTLALGACDGDGATAAPDATTAATPDTRAATTAPDAQAPDGDASAPDVDARPPIVATERTFIGDWEMPPGEEITKCVVKRLDNVDPMWVSSVTTTLSPGSHHLIVYKSSETEERTEPFNCAPFAETFSGETFPLMITQIREETLSFPDGVAFKFEPRQMVRLEAHYLNYYPDPITAHADVDFEAIDEADVEAEANMLFYGNPDIDIPPQSEHATPWRHLSVPAGTEVFAITGHTHQLGTNVEITWSTSADDEGTAVYPGDAPFQWDEAPVVTFEPPLTFEEGQGFRYRCSWDNDTDRRVRFGESATSEMCFFWAYYFPSDGYRICINPGSLDQNGLAGDELCCPGHFLCGALNGAL